MRSAKVMLLGEMGVGKTSIAHRFAFNRFRTDYKTTIGVELFTHDVTVEAGGETETLRLVLWDTDGDFGQRIFDTVYVTGASAALVIADASRPPTVAHMNALLRSFEERFPGRPAKAIVNKIDLIEGGASAFVDPDIRREDVVFTSARTGEGVARAFDDLAATVLRRA